jgi:hypothetical protein
MRGGDDVADCEALRRTVGVGGAPVLAKPRQRVGDGATKDAAANVWQRS